MGHLSHARLWLLYDFGVCDFLFLLFFQCQLVEMMGQLIGSFELGDWILEDASRQVRFKHLVRLFAQVWLDCRRLGDASHLFISLHGCLRVEKHFSWLGHLCKSALFRNRLLHRGLHLLQLALDEAILSQFAVVDLLFRL